MKFISSQFSLFFQHRAMRRNLSYLMRFATMLVGMIAVYTVLFHYIMNYEDREYSWITGVYWTLTVMSTLGFGDITFTSDLGRFFSIIVLLSGVIFLLVMLPFTFIQYFYAPWLEAQKKEQTPRSLPAGTHGHVILVGTGAITLNLVDDLTRYGVHCVLLCPDTHTTLELLDQGYKAIVGEHDNGDVYRRLQVGEAAMLVALDSDVRNTNIVFSAREVDAVVPIVARVENDASLDILQLAGATYVFQFHKLLGEALARRGIGGQTRSGELCRYGELVVAEAPVMHTPLVGKTLRNSGLRRDTGVNVAGVWERGRFWLPTPDTVFTHTMVAVVVGTAEQMEAFDRFRDVRAQSAPPAPVLILGGGRVGLAAASLLNARGVRHVIVDKSDRFTAPASRIHGDAADLEILERAGIRTAPSVIITTHDDDTNIYLTLYCRRLRPDIQIVSRATLDRNVNVLHGAGADLVLSLASMISSNLINLLSPGKLLMINEGLNIFRVHAGRALAGKNLVHSGIRDQCNCSVVAIKGEDGRMLVNPVPEYVFTLGDEVYLIGDYQAENLYYEKFGPEKHMSESLENAVD